MDRHVFLYLIALPINILSLVGSFFIIFLFIIAKPLRTYMFRLILIVSINDFIRSAILIIPLSYYENELNQTPVCSGLGFIFIFTLIGTNFWIFAIVFTMFQVLILNKEKIERFFWVWFSSILAYQLFFCFFLLVTDSYGFDQNTCVVKSSYIINIYTLFMYFIPVWIEIFAIICIYLIIFMKYRKINLDIVSKPKVELIRFLRVPFIMIFCLIPISIDVFLATVDYGPDILDNIAVCVYSSHGFLNSLAFSLSRPVISYLKGFSKQEVVEIDDDLINKSKF